jgi:ABC-type Mn2+/Zn2+ transport system ATPase subunit
MNDPIIRCRDLAVAYGRYEVLRGVNLDIPRGAFLPFTGPNGAGKTTLLRAILGLLPLRRGHIETPFRHAPAGYVPQQKSIDPLYPVSARRIVEMGLYRERRWLMPLSREQRARVDEVLEMLGMGAHANKVFRELSGGMKQKILIARALVSGAEVIVLDEPTSELDDASEREVLRYLQQLNRSHGKTVLMVHHDLELVASLTDRVCRVRRGAAELVSVGAGQEGDDA